MVPADAAQRVAPGEVNCNVPPYCNDAALGEILEISVYPGLTATDWALRQAELASRAKGRK